MVDVLSQLGAVTRDLRTGDADGEALHVQSLEQFYDAPIDDVWEAVTTSERIARWFQPVTGDLRLGGRYQVEGNAGGEILECRPPAGDAASYRVTWEYGGGLTWLSLRLTAESERTRLTLEHVARVADVPADMWETFGPGATGVGWDMALLGLALHLGNLEGSISPSEAEAWMLSDEGKRFSRDAADAWAGVHVASGADPDAARRAADATYGFYSGASVDGA